MNLADTLINIALGNTFSSTALLEAKNHPVTSNNDAQMLTRYMYGTQTSTDHLTLQELANYIKASL